MSLESFEQWAAAIADACKVARALVEELEELTEGDAAAVLRELWSELATRGLVASVDWTTAPASAAGSRIRKPVELSAANPPAAEEPPNAVDT